MGSRGLSLNTKFMWKCWRVGYTLGELGEFGVNLTDKFAAKFSVVFGHTLALTPVLINYARQRKYRKRHPELPVRMIISTWRTSEWLM
jgi:hypothetical protein